MSNPAQRSTSSPVQTDFQQQVERLHRLSIYSRWAIVGVLWLTIGSLSLWGFRYPISLMRDHFTWAALRYGIVFERIPAIGLALCIGATVAVLVGQSRNILFGIAPEQRQRLQDQVQRIRQQGESHPLWRVIHPSKR